MSFFFCGLVEISRPLSFGLSPKADLKDGCDSKEVTSRTQRGKFTRLIEITRKKTEFSPVFVKLFDFYHH